MARRHRYGSFTPARRAALRKAQLESAKKRKGSGRVKLHFTRNRGKYASAGVAAGVLTAAVARHKLTGSTFGVSVHSNSGIGSGSVGMSAHQRPKPGFSSYELKSVNNYTSKVYRYLGKPRAKTGNSVSFHYNHVPTSVLFGKKTKNTFGSLEDVTPTITGQREPKNHYTVKHLYGTSLKYPPKQSRRRGSMRVLGEGPLKIVNGFVVGRN